MPFKLVPKGSQIYYSLEQLYTKLYKNNWDLET